MPVSLGVTVYCSVMVSEVKCFMFLYSVTVLYCCGTRPPLSSRISILCRRMGIICQQLWRLLLFYLSITKIVYLYDYYVLAESLPAISQSVNSEADYRDATVSSISSSHSVKNVSVLLQTRFKHTFFRQKCNFLAIKVKKKIICKHEINLFCGWHPTLSDNSTWSNQSVSSAWRMS